MCLFRNQHKPLVPTKRRQCYKLSELPPAYHCSLVGTCFSMPELQKLIHRFQLGTDDMSEYDQHHALVQVIGRDTQISKYLNKYLNKKYAVALKHYRKITCEKQLLSAWRQDLAQGQYIGAFWATMSHPLAQDPLWYCAHGDIHMLSHQVAQKKFTDVHLIQQLQDENSTLQAHTERLHRQLNKHTQRHTTLEATNQRLLAELDRIKQDNKRLREHPPATPEHKDVAAISVLQNRHQQLYQQYRQAQQTVTEHEQTQQVLQTQNRHIQNECNALENQLQRVLSYQKSYQPANDAQGYKVLYVGGRVSNCAHMRHLVEQENGKFQHHDGGLEENTANLDGLLCHADFIMCPIDCISHDACLKVKKYCKRYAKPFIPLRNSGLSSFSAGLEQGRRRLCAEG